MANDPAVRPCLLAAGALETDARQRFLRFLDQKRHPFEAKLAKCTSARCLQEILLRLACGRALLLGSEVLDSTSSDRWGQRV